VLQELKLGKQASGYKTAQKALNQFIAVFRRYKFQFMAFSRQLDLAVVCVARHLFFDFSWEMGQQCQVQLLKVSPHPQNFVCLVPSWFLRVCLFFGSGVSTISNHSLHMVVMALVMAVALAVALESKYLLHPLSNHYHSHKSFVHDL